MPDDHAERIADYTAALKRGAASTVQPRSAVDFALLVACEAASRGQSFRALELARAACNVDEHRGVATRHH